MHDLASIGSLVLALASSCAAPDPRPATPAATLPAPAPAEPRTEHGYTRNVAVLVFAGVELLDFTGPMEAFTVTRGFDEPLRVYTVGVDTRPVRTGNRLVVVPDYSIADAPQPDILVIPGGEVACLDPGQPLGEYIRAQVPKVEIAFSVCNGVFSLSASGFLDGLEATTHEIAIGWLRSAAPRTVVRDDVRFVDNGHIVTAAGVSAGIDGALHLVDRLLGPDCARRAAGRMQYVWTDGPADVDPPEDPVEIARRAWYSEDWPAVAERYAPIVASRPDDGIAAMRLGTGLLFTKRTAEALPHLERAEALGERGQPLYLALGYALVRSSRPAEALAVYERGIGLHPGSIELRRAVGMSQAAAGRHREAIANLEIVLASGLGVVDVWSAIARCQASVGDREGAIATLAILASSEPEALPELLADPAFAELRDDPRVAALRDSRPPSPSASR